MNACDDLWYINITNVGKIHLNEHARKNGTSCKHCDRNLIVGEGYRHTMARKTMGSSISYLCQECVAKILAEWKNWSFNASDGVFYMNPRSYPHSILGSSLAQAFQAKGPVGLLEVVQPF